MDDLDWEEIREIVMALALLCGCPFVLGVGTGWVFWGWYG